MNQLQIISQDGQRVLITSQLAESYGTDSERITKNFNRNKERYKEGKHFLALEGKELKDFRATCQIDLLPNINKLYLWTEKGAWLHAKSLKTDEAWDAYEMLVDDYYSVKENIPTLTKEEAEALLFRRTADMIVKIPQLEQKIEEVDQKVDKQITLTQWEQRKLQREVKRKVYKFSDDKEERKYLFPELYREIYDRWGIPSYRDVLRKDLENVITYINAWVPKKKDEEKGEIA
ncbi:ORF6N domain-containing protein [Chengkuizengella marina]|uniref:Phage anti-repressor protein n=1 Tax=Chengkuizengella marina TaxID=2507566 RepID=A0A6N9Q4C5_9BACL|nr:ORF6N domain-containing protein [Chengkuizengella marina]NBI29464.1 hypothetical protein [Chengkuizengella marina]